MRRKDELEKALATPGLKPEIKIDLQYELARELFSQDPQKMKALSKEAADSALEMGYEKGRQEGKIFTAWSTWSADIKHALKLFHEVHDWARHNNENVLMGESKSSIGILLWSFGDYDRGLKYCNDSLNILRREGKWYNVVWVLTSLGNFYYDLEHYTESKIVFEEALELLEQHDETYDLSRCYNGIANNLLKLGNLDESLKYQKMALANAVKSNNTIMESRILNDMGLYNQATNNFTKARTYHLKSLSLRKKLDYLPGQITSLLDAGDSCLALERLEESGHYYAQALQMSDNVNAKPKSCRALKGLSDIHKKNNDYQNAYHYLNKLHELESAFIREDGNRRIENLKKTWEAENALKESEIYQLKNVDLKNKNEQLQDAFNKLKAVNAQIVQTEKMAIVGKLVAGFSHEINSPLGALKSGNYNIQLIGKKLHSSLPEKIPSQSESHNKLAELLIIGAENNDVSIARIERLMKNLRAFIHLEEAELQLTDIHSGIKTVLEMLEIDLPRGITINTNFTKVPKVLTFPQEFNQALMNLSQNAVNAMGESGTLKVETHQNKDSILIKVKDTGPGIAENDLPKLFEPDFVEAQGRIKMKSGLFTVAQIMEKHGGTIKVKSKMGKGSIFTMMLPVLQKLPV